MLEDRAVAGASGTWSDIHWPAGFAPSYADSFLHDEIMIAAPAERVFGHLVDVARWPSWFPQVRRVRLTGGLRPGGSFEIEIFGLRLDGLVGEWVVPSRFGWAGTSVDLSIYQAWRLLPVPSGTRVIAEQVERGPTAVAAGDRRAGRIRDGYRELLLRLKRLAEESEAGRHVEPGWAAGPDAFLR
ncbi:SRPBCC family protein [Micromonospora sp. NPDC049523]|uniref:SRPBCC family protein n=1 Tax=Micromonospora sp. NPDC049523 TaxID=3155921 RepID=UPI00341BDA6E